MLFCNCCLKKFVIYLTMTCFAAKASQDFWWKNNRIVRHERITSNVVRSENLRPLQDTRIFQRPQFVPTLDERTITGIHFDCSNKPTGPNKDNHYCDIYHACVFGKQQKTYVCAHNGEPFYYDEKTQKCEFSSKNPSGCLSGKYYASVVNTNNQVGNEFKPSIKNGNECSYCNDSSTLEVSQSTSQSKKNNSIEHLKPLDSWRQYVRGNDVFSCSNKPDGFYSSRWCNVYYRCFGKNKFEFLCAKMKSGGRLWWKEHGSSKSTSESEAQCQWPCDTGRPCASPGGILVDDGSVRESSSEAQMVFDSCSKAKMRNPTSREYAWSFLQVYGQENSGKSDLYYQKVKEYPRTDKKYNWFSDDAKTRLEYFFENTNNFNRMPDKENFCEGATDGSFVPNPLYCNLFHVCVKGLRKDFLCAKGSNSYDLWWNDATKQCEWPCKLKCDKKIFGSLNSAAEISVIDYNLNPVLCKINQKMTVDKLHQF